MPNAQVIAGRKREGYRTTLWSILTGRPWQRQQRRFQDLDDISL